VQAARGAFRGRPSRGRGRHEVNRRTAAQATGPGSVRPWPARRGTQLRSRGVATGRILCSP
jgi:hypothetical protein